MRKVVAALALSFCTAGAAHADPWKLDADIEACTDVATRTQDQIYDCLDRLVRVSNAALADTYTKAVARVDTKSQALLKAAEDEFYKFAAMDVAASHGPWRDTPNHHFIEMYGMENAITATRERTNELSRLYLSNEQ